ncbi:hypothetical protein LOTGIDRAFT_229767 [Lottia gigantea]|uniref:Hint domain-containing protein n=1 Tax=Lottia gigantea TaxID=225164 RepID=V3YXC4_LOTGI|nr:hypothetical protein LOTGIDRAFT_229767 [Lottia gigantea]ESO82723.1 hypothetical protein LOTGIDRAFT_229767 [Lottia gigantea]
MTGPAPICDCCFPGQETSFVTLKNDKRRIEDVEVGDEVKVITDQLEFRYSRVYALGHKNKDRKTMFIELGTASSRIPISPRHFIKIYDNGNIIEKFAKDVKVGDTLLIDNNDQLVEEPVLEIDHVEAQGLYAPFTEEGNIIINNVVASCYAEVKSSLAHKLLSPIRGLSRYLPTPIMDLVMTPNNDGVPMVFDATLNVAHPLVAE